MGATSVTVEHCCPALPSVWVRRDSLSQDREKQLLPRHHHSLHPWDCGFLIHTQQQTHQIHFCSSTSNTEVLQSSRGLLYKMPKEDAQVSHSCTNGNMFLPAFGPKLQLKRAIPHQPSLRDMSVLSQAYHKSPGEVEEAIINALTKLLR